MEKILVFILWASLMQIADAQNTPTSRAVNVNLSYRLHNLSSFQQDSVLKSMFQQYPNTIELDLSANNLQRLPDEICNLKNLKVLDLRSNKLTELPKNIEQLSKLEVLDLVGNELIELPENIGQLSKLRKLEIYYNPLKRLPNGLFKLSNLEGLDISNCPIENKKDPRFAQLRNLRYLNMGDLDTLSQAIIELPLLKYLWLSPDCDHLKLAWAQYKLLQAKKAEAAESEIKDYEAMIYYYQSLNYEKKGQLKKTGKMLELCYDIRKELNPNEYGYSLVRTFFFYENNNFKNKEKQYFRLCLEASKNYPLLYKDLTLQLFGSLRYAARQGKSSFVNKYYGYLKELGVKDWSKILPECGWSPEEEFQSMVSIILNFGLNLNKAQLYCLINDARRLGKTDTETIFTEKYLQLDLLEYELDTATTHLRILINRYQSDKRLDLAISCAKQLVALEQKKNDAYLHMHSWRILAWLQRLNAQYTDAWASLQNSWQMALTQRWGDQRDKALEGFHAVIQDSKNAENVLDLLKKWYESLNEEQHATEINFMKERYAEILKK